MKLTEHEHAAAAYVQAQQLGHPGACEAARVRLVKARKGERK